MTKIVHCEFRFFTDPRAGGKFMRIDSEVMSRVLRSAGYSCFQKRGYEGYFIPIDDAIKYMTEQEREVGENETLTDMLMDMAAFRDGHTDMEERQ